RSQSQEHIRTIGANRATNFDSHALAIASKRPGRRLRDAVEYQTPMPREIGRHQRATVARQIFRTGADNLGEIDDLTCDQRGVRKLSCPHRYVDILRDEIDRAVRHQEIDRYPRIAS